MSQVNFDKRIVPSYVQVKMAGGKGSLFMLRAEIREQRARALTALSKITCLFLLVRFYLSKFFARLFVALVSRYLIVLFLYFYTIALLPINLTSTSWCESVCCLRQSRAHEGIGTPRSALDPVIVTQTTTQTNAKRETETEIEQSALSPIALRSHSRRGGNVELWLGKGRSSKWFDLHWYRRWYSPIRRPVSCVSCVHKKADWKLKTSKKQTTITIVDKLETYSA